MTILILNPWLLQEVSEYCIYVLHILGLEGVWNVKPFKPQEDRHILTDAWSSGANANIYAWDESNVVMLYEPAVVCFVYINY